MINGHKIVVVDYGMGNLFNIQRALHHLGEEAHISADVNDIRHAQRLIIPGVGAFEKAMKNLQERRLIDPIKEFAATQRPLLGICLGMQLFFSESTEFGLHKGLNLIPGTVQRFPESVTFEHKVPLIGWNTITWSKNQSSEMANGIKNNAYFYYVHSYYCTPEHKNDVLATTNYAGIDFCSITQKNNIIGCQFHPERSAETGLSLFENFIKI